MADKNTRKNRIKNVLKGAGKVIMTLALGPFYAIAGLIGGTGVGMVDAIQTMKGKTFKDYVNDVDKYYEEHDDVINETSDKE